MTSGNIYLPYTEAKGNQKMNKRGTKGAANQIVDNVFYFAMTIPIEAHLGIPVAANQSRQ